MTSFSQNEEKQYTIIMTHKEISRIIDWWEDNDVPDFIDFEKIFKHALGIMK